MFIVVWIFPTTTSKALYEYLYLERRNTDTSSYNRLYTLGIYEYEQARMKTNTTLHKTD